VALSTKRGMKQKKKGGFNAGQHFKQNGGDRRGEHGKTDQGKKDQKHWIHKKRPLAPDGGTIGNVTSVTPKE